jgi:hypothetical protein
MWPSNLDRILRPVLDNPKFTAGESLTLFQDFLKDRGVLERWAELVVFESSHSGFPESTYFNIIFEQPAHSWIDGSFVWANSEEGHGFWSTLAYEWWRLETLNKACK